MQWQPFYVISVSSIVSFSLLREIKVIKDIEIVFIPKSHILLFDTFKFKEFRDFMFQNEANFRPFYVSWLPIMFNFSVVNLQAESIDLLNQCNPLSPISAFLKISVNYFKPAPIPFSASIRSHIPNTPSSLIELSEALIYSSFNYLSF